MKTYVQNLVSVVTHILAVPNVTEQRDGRRDTPLMLARKRGLAGLEQALLQAGANDLPSSSPSAGRTAWCAGRSPVYIANAIGIGSPPSDCGNMTPCDQVSDYSYLHTSRKSINAAASVTCLVLFHHLGACLQSFKVVSLQGNIGHTALILSQQGMSPVAPKAMAVPCTTLHLLFKSRQD